MDGNEPKQIARRSPPPTLSYGQLETALAKVYEAADVQQTAFRGRLKHFRKLGIPQRRPGKGTRIRYTSSDVFQLMLACEFAEFGIDPHLIADIVRRDWRTKGNLFQVIDLTQRLPGNDFHVVIDVRFMSWVWNRAKFIQTSAESSMSEVSAPAEIRFFKASESEILLKERLRTGQRFSIFNLSARVREVEQALREVEESLTKGQSDGRKKTPLDDSLYRKDRLRRRLR